MIHLHGRWREQTVKCRGHPGGCWLASARLSFRTKGARAFGPEPIRAAIFHGLGPFLGFHFAAGLALEDATRCKVRPPAQMEVFGQPGLWTVAPSSVVQCHVVAVAMAVLAVTKSSNNTACESNSNNCSAENAIGFAGTSCASMLKQLHRDGGCITNLLAKACFQKLHVLDFFVTSCSCMLILTAS